MSTAASVPLPPSLSSQGSNNSSSRNVLLATTPFSENDNASVYTSHTARTIRKSNVVHRIPATPPRNDIQESFSSASFPSGIFGTCYRPRFTLTSSSTSGSKTISSISTVDEEDDRKLAARQRSSDTSVANPDANEPVLQAIKGLDDRFEGLEERLGKLECRFGGLEDRLGAVEAAVGAGRAAVAGHDTTLFEATAPVDAEQDELAHGMDFAG